MELFLPEIYRGMRVCVALSGGVDSVCLLHAFWACAKEYGIALSAAHVEHGIRGEESLHDLAFCEQLCTQWGIPLYVKRVDVPARAAEEKRGIEETSRLERYAFFDELRAQYNVDVIATAHHMNDVAETVLFRLARGTAPSGMKGITEREGIVRPMLGVTRQQIEAYAAEHKLPHVEDGTNSDDTYARNRIRHGAIPALEGVNANAVRHIARFAEFSAADDEFLQGLAASKIVHRNGEACVPVDLPDPLFLRACLLCMRAFGAKRDYTAANLEEVGRLRNLQSGTRASLPNGVGAVREYGFVVFYGSAPCPEKELPFTAKVGTMYAVNEFGFSVSSEKSEGALFCDMGAFPEGCVVRTRREGDVFTPYRSSKKTLKKYLSDKKISARLGKRLPLIAKGDEILVVVGVEISDKVKVTENTERIGYIR